MADQLQPAADRPPHITRTTLLRAVHIAQRAPSVHNTQPWRWRLGTDRVRLYADRGRALPATDPAGRELLISCGAVLHHLVVVLRAGGWGTTVERFPDRGDDRPLAELSLRPSDPGPGDLAVAAAVSLRRTDRRPFAPWTLPPGWWHVLFTAAAVHRARLVPVEADALWTVGQLTEAAGARLAAVPGVRAELAAWSGRPAGAPDGVAAVHAPAGLDTGRLPWRQFAGARLEGPPASADGDGAQVAVLTTDDDGPLDHLRAGEALSAVLLHATAAGFATQVVSEVVEVPETRARLAREVSDPTQWPQVLVRVGWSPTGHTAVPVTGRRPVEDTVDAWVDGRG